MKKTNNKKIKYSYILYIRTKIPRGLYRYTRLYKTRHLPFSSSPPSFISVELNFLKIFHRRTFQIEERNIYLYKTLPFFPAPINRNVSLSPKRNIFLFFFFINSPFPPTPILNPRYRHLLAHLAINSRSCYAAVNATLPGAIRLKIYCNTILFYFFLPFFDFFFFILIPSFHRSVAHIF